MTQIPNYYCLLIIFLISFLLNIGKYSFKPFDVFINEISSNNRNRIINGYGNYSDWIEFYNSGENEVDLSGFGLSNEFYIPFKWRFPNNSIIFPGEYLIVFASDNKSNNKELHLNFKLQKNGESLFFSDSNFNLIEKIDIPSLEEDETYGRDEKHEFKKMIPTPGYKNKILISSPIFSNHSGFYNKDFYLSLSTSEQYEIYYTTDGSDPLNSKTSQIYEHPILIYDRTEEPNIYSEYGENENSSISISIGTNYKPPLYPLDKAMVVRAVSKNSYGISKVVDNIYFVTTGNLSIYKNYTIVSIITNPDNLYDPDKGIYVTGNRYLKWLKEEHNQGETVPNDILNYFCRGPDWEREANIKIFEKGNISVEQNMGIRIKGSSSRGNPGKSFNLIAKKKYGLKDIEANIFPENKNIDGKLINKYSSLSLLCINSKSRFRNEFATKIIHNRIDLTTTDMKNGIVFLNGEYFGMYVITEKFTDDFIESYYNIPKNNVALIKDGTNEEGQEEEYINYVSFLKEYSKKDLREKQYYDVVSNIDIDSLIEHYAVGLYLATFDWPNHNYGAWRNMGEKIDNNKYSDGKWRFITFDLETTMGNYYGDIGGIEVYEYNTFNRVIKKMSSPPTYLFIALSKNEDFRNKFINIYCDYVNDVMSLYRINLIIEDFKENVTELIANSLQKWRGNDRKYYEGYTINKKEFYSFLETLRTYFIERPNYTLMHLKEFFNLTGEFYELTIEKEGNGKIMINSILPNFIDDKWVGKYFYNIPVKITAIPLDNNTFFEWNGDYKSNKNTIYISLIKPISIKGVFK